MDAIQRMERMIEAEPDKIKRWAMRRELELTIKHLEGLR
jgi:hypothetical protein